MSVYRRYLKNPRLINFEEWVEREFETIERVMASEVTGLRWDDLRFPSQGINPAGAANPATPDNTDGTLSFSGTGDKVIAGVAQMPHSWQDGTAIRPHIHLQFKTSASANTRWKLTWDIANVNGDFGVTTGDNTITVANPQNVNKHALAAFAEISMDGFRDSCIIKWTVSRLAQSDAADNDTNAANLLEFDIHYQLGSHGSVAEYPS